MRHDHSEFLSDVQSFVNFAYCAEMRPATLASSISEHSSKSFLYEYAQVLPAYCTIPP
jgi:hypothetical protein